MSDVALRVEGLGKRFRVQGGGGLAGASYRTMRETMTNLVTAPFSRRAESRKEAREYWALKDVSFEVKTGEVVGLIGRNGAGKSTLLKVLSRITEPTAGFAEIHGRVGSLLEVGTGFHPELSGRENVFLNGAILGMTRAEIGRKFEEIVAFAEIEKFIDAPVKFYSSGMFVRLAFAVAAHLEPEILFVDEVLAVGDAAFQRKCLGKMENVARSGRTVILVSHNMGAIAELCTHGVLLDGGTVNFSGAVGPAIEGYGRLIQKSQAETSFGHETWRGASIVAARVLGADREPRSVFDISDDILLEFDYCVQEKQYGLQLSFSISRNF
ncbi:MAG TPA: ABC transporter ATP-binding protein, partial [Rhizomicrobium sp.]|nr:ABC transporter ATP-binding protein [Rhizomicrobium sp.]